MDLFVKKLLSGTPDTITIEYYETYYRNDQYFTTIEYGHRAFWPALQVGAYPYIVHTVRPDGLYYAVSEQSVSPIPFSDYFTINGELGQAGSSITYCHYNLHTNTVPYETDVMLFNHVFHRYAKWGMGTGATIQEMFLPKGFIYGKSGYLIIDSYDGPIISVSASSYSQKRGVYTYTKSLVGGPFNISL